jgi:hypothetical protein
LFWLGFIAVTLEKEWMKAAERTMKKSQEEERKMREEEKRTLFLLISSTNSEKQRNHKNKVIPIIKESIDIHAYSGENKAETPDKRKIDSCEPTKHRKKPLSLSSVCYDTALCFLLFSFFFVFSSF